MAVNDRLWWAMVSDGCDSGAANEDYYDHRADRTDNIVTKAAPLQPGTTCRAMRAQPSQDSCWVRCGWG